MMNVFDTTNFMPRFHCINQSQELAVLYFLPNIGIFFVYSIGFVSIYIFMRQRAHVFKLRFVPTIMVAYGLFFFFCGGTHLNDAVALWWPAYKFFILWEWIQLILAIWAFTYTLAVMRRYIK